MKSSAPPVPKGSASNDLMWPNQNDSGKVVQWNKVWSSVVDGDVNCYFSSENLFIVVFIQFAQDPFFIFTQFSFTRNTVSYSVLV